MEGGITQPDLHLKNTTLAAGQRGLKEEKNGGRKASWAADG